ncbi:hypothetical protein [Arthrobacter sp. KNU40]|uniref:hypothetical protein n=1 Tax=Arthrobacter sp. KNU40 TaxID=3447965 RepID=UPI003F6234A8
MTIETERPQTESHPLRWPGEWLRDEKFWRDVASRTASGLIILFVGYWTALIIGFIKTPDNFKASYQVTVGMLIVVLAVWWEGRFPSRKIRNRLTIRFRLRFPRWFARLHARTITLVLQLGSLMLIAILAGIVLKIIFNVAARILGIDASV